MKPILLTTKTTLGKTIDTLAYIVRWVWEWISCVCRLIIGLFRATPAQTSCQVPRQTSPNFPRYRLDARGNEAPGSRNIPNNSSRGVSHLDTDSNAGSDTDPHFDGKTDGGTLEGMLSLTRSNSPKWAQGCKRTTTKMNRIQK